MNPSSSSSSSSRVARCRHHHLLQHHTITYCNTTPPSLHQLHRRQLGRCLACLCQRAHTPRAQWRARAHDAGLIAWMQAKHGRQSWTVLAGADPGVLACGDVDVETWGGALRRMLIGGEHMCSGAATRASSPSFAKANRPRR